MVEELFPCMEDVFFKNRKGEILAGLLFGGSRRNAPVVIVCHGFTGSKEGRGKAVEMAQLLERSGYSALLFDFAGCGQSEGKFEDLTLSGHIEDLTCAVDFCLARGLGPVTTLGRSFGGSTAICQAASDRRVSGVCTWAAPASLTDLFFNFTDGDLPEDENALIPLEGNEGMVYLKKSFFTDLASHDIARCSSLISPRPLLVVQGTGDEVVPPAEASIIYNAAGSPKELIYIEGADHQFSSHYEKVWAIFLDWLKRIG
ncbi:MAG: alpha/beta fold hydrolase [Peptococcaceae bacterium]|nr:alpha/beta fold hydrolase [Peptococcaceae bacterium]